MISIKQKSFIWAVASAPLLLAIYFTIVLLMSGFDFALKQFSAYWYFVVGLAIGFGAQVGFYIYLKNLIKQSAGARSTLIVSGTTSTAAMISCCSHYLVNVLPLIGVAGLAVLIGQYQIELFLLGLSVNLLALVYLISKIFRFKNI